MKTAKKISALESVVSANNSFALDFYRECVQSEGNIFFSPYSISSALAMTYEGAKGSTAEEMEKVLHFPKKAGMRKGFMGLNSEINKGEKDYKLSTANALWAQHHYKNLKAYNKNVEIYYNREARNMDFAKDPEGSRNTMNTWVEDHTNKKIKDLIPQGVIDEATRLVLTNAVYFFSKWLKPFSKDRTYDAEFLTTTGKVDAKMMRFPEEQHLNYAEKDNIQILELPYTGDEVSMLFLLPKLGEMGNLEKILSVEKINEWRQILAKESVQAYIPKFKFTAKYSMAGTLSNMGMPTAFSGAADFSGMTGKKDLQISQVIHQAFIDVNEESTEAAGATAVIIRCTSAMEPQYKTFMADHPFLFLIQQRKTGNILFQGRMSNPS
ncbi:MAG: serpin family protein [Nanoarchaeota archaeon]|nr:serpin family protein [Nanoarchaeota archaeon]